MSPRKKSNKMMENVFFKLPSPDKKKQMIIKTNIKYYNLTSLIFILEVLESQKSNVKQHIY